MLRKIVLAMGFIIMAVLVYNWIQEWGSINHQLHWASETGKGVHQKYGIWFIIDRIQYCHDGLISSKGLSG
jgi:hypothetical protein